VSEHHDTGLAHAGGDEDFQSRTLALLEQAFKPVVGIVCKEIPILKLLLELLVDFFRVLIQILGQTEERVWGNRCAQWPQESKIEERQLHDRIRTAVIGQESSNIGIPTIAELFLELLPIGTCIITWCCRKIDCQKNGFRARGKYGGMY